MKVSRNWLQTFFDQELPSADELSRVLTFGAFEMESVEVVGDDAVLDIKVLPNRAHDCLSHRGIAKELSVLLDIPLSRDPLAEAPGITFSDEMLSVSVADPKSCPVYLAALMTNVTIGPSPAWLKQKLEALGQRSINNVVDATNYVMLETGQPLHVFDAKKLGIKDGHPAIHVRMAKAGESITVLGGAIYELDESIQLITDATTDRPLAIAGIKGGVQAEVDVATTDIVLESAKFHPALTRKASQRLKLRTDASYRFENEIPDELPRYGLSVLAKLITEIAAGRLVASAGYEAPRARHPYKVGISSGEINKRLGTNLTDEAVAAIFDRFGFSYEHVTDPRAKIVERAGSVLGAVYKRMARIRFDTPDAFNCATLTAWCAIEAGYTFGIPRITIDQFAYLDEIGEENLLPGDFVFTNTEEVRTLSGENYSSVLDKVVQDEAVRTKTLEYLPGTDIGHGVDHVGVYVGEGEVIHAGSAVGGVVKEKLSESPTFAKEKWYRRVVAADEARFVVTVPFARLDVRMGADMIEEVGRVYGYGNISAEQLSPLSEAPKIHKTFYYTQKIRDILTKEGFSEVMTSSFAEKGEIALANALADDKKFLRASLDTALEDAFGFNSTLLPLLNLNSVSQLKIFEIGTVFDKNGEHLELGLYSDKEKDIDAALETFGETFGKKPEHKHGMMNLTTYLETLADPHSYDDLHNIDANFVSYRAPSLYPFVLRDIAFWAPENVAPDEAREIIRDAAGPLLVRTTLFDTFAKEGRMSYAFHLVFQSYEKTLSDDAVNTIMETVTTALGKRQWEVR